MQQLEQAVQSRDVLMNFLQAEIGAGTAILKKEVFDPAEMLREGRMRENRQIMSWRF